jgi:hypothetical protein
MDQIDEVTSELQQIKGESAIVVKLKEGLKENRVILTNQDEISLKEWHTSLRTVFIYYYFFKFLKYKGTSSFSRIVTKNGS